MAESECTAEFTTIQFANSVTELVSNTTNYNLLTGFNCRPNS